MMVHSRYYVRQLAAIRRMSSRAVRQNVTFLLSSTEEFPQLFISSGFLFRNQFLSSEQLRKARKRATSGMMSDGRIVLFMHNKYKHHYPGYYFSDQGVLLFLEKEVGGFLAPSTLLPSESTVSLVGAFYQEFSVHLLRIAADDLFGIVLSNGLQDSLVVFFQSEPRGQLYEALQSIAGRKPYLQCVVVNTQGEQRFSNFHLRTPCCSLATGVVLHKKKKHEFIQRLSGWTPGVNEALNSSIIQPSVTRVVDPVLGDSVEFLNDLLFLGNI